MRVKFGIDPTSDKLHLGHFAVLRQLRKLQEQGHEIVIILGTFTAQIGDPTGRDKSRPTMTADETTANANAIVHQIRNIMGQKVRIESNASWLADLKLEDLISTLGKVTLNQMLQKESFKSRLVKNEPISLHELLYPILQGLDSIQIDADVEAGGSDQLFNIQMGKTLQEKFGREKGQEMMTFEILEGVNDSAKMSKSLNNQINLTDSSRMIFDRILAIADRQIGHFARLLTDISVEGMGPKEAKEAIAVDVLRQLGKELRMDDFQAVRISGELDLPSVLVEVGVVKSKSIARQKIAEGAVSLLVGDEFSAIKHHQFLVEDGFVIQFGKRKFRIEVQNA